MQAPTNGDHPPAESPHDYLGNLDDDPEAALARHLPEAAEFDRCCAYCGVVLTNKSRSKEHIYPKWLRQYLPNPIGINEHIGTVTFESRLQHADGKLGEPLATVRRAAHGRLNSHGGPLSHTLAVVCKDCNHGWMSRVTEAAKRPLVPLIQGRWSTISDDDALSIVRFAVLFSMTYEFAHIDSMAMDAAERRRFMETLDPGPNWRVWFARYTGVGWEGSTNHFGIGVASSLHQATPTRPRHLSQSTALRLGSLFIYTYGTRSAVSAEAEAVAQEPGVVTAWPQLGARRQFPFVLFDSDSADRLNRLCLPEAVRPSVLAGGAGSEGIRWLFSGASVVGVKCPAIPINSAPWPATRA